MKYDIHIVKKAIKGDVAAFEQLLIQEEKQLYYMALSYVRNKDDALDALQETAYNALLSIGKLRKPQYFSTWLVKILIRECYKLLKEKNRIIPYEEKELMMKLSYTESNEINLLYVKEAVNQLKKEYQTAIILFYYHDLTIKDIAEVMEKPIGTVKTYLRRGRKNLKNELERSNYAHEKVTSFK